MGQYYEPIEIESGKWLSAHDYDNGLKLMEHSYIGNNFVGVVMKLLTIGNKWHKKPIVWCGDYFSEEGEEDYCNKVKEKNKIKPSESMSEEKQEKAILINHTKKEYVFLIQNPQKRVINKLKDELTINPLPLLLALGNQRGGGDYYGSDEDKVGYWARDVISVDFEVPEGYKELKVNFKEK